MKYLTDYISEAQTAAFDEAGAFFAFGTEQFKKQQVEGVKYVNMGGGLICPKETYKTLSTSLETIAAAGMAQDLKENGKEGVIARELGNHEYGYTGDISDTVDTLAGYGITRKEVAQVARGDIGRSLIESS